MRRRQILVARAEEARAAKAPDTAPVRIDNVKVLREAKGLTRAEVSKRTGLSENYVRTIEGMEQARTKILKALRE